MANKKKRAEKPQREMTRRHLALWQREKRRQRIIFGAGVFIIAAIVLIVLGGWYASEYRPFHQTAIRVYDTEFDTGYYIDTLKIVGEGQSVEYVQSLTASMIREIEQNELIKQGAREYDISVSDDEVKKKLIDSDIAVNEASLDLMRNQMLGDRMTKEYFDSLVPVSDNQVYIQAVLLESESQATEVRARLQNSENFTALAEEFSLDSYTKSNKGDIGWHPQDILADLLGSSVPGDYAFGSEVGVLSQPRYDGDIIKSVGYWLVKVLEKEEGATEAQVQAILLGSQPEAADVKARLEAGEDFATLAKELSQHEGSKGNGGELGMVKKGDMSPAVDEYIFNPEVKSGALSDPIRDETASTKGGYWLIKVVDRENDRLLEAADRDSLKAKAFYEWVTSLWVVASGSVDDSYLDAARQAWAAEQAVKG